MKIRSAVPENGSHIFDGRKKQKKNTKKQRTKKQKKQKKTSVKHIRICLIGGCVNNLHCATIYIFMSQNIQHRNGN